MYFSFLTPWQASESVQNMQSLTCFYFSPSHIRISANPVSARWEHTRDVHVIKIPNYYNLFEPVATVTNMEGNKDEAKKCLEIARRFLAKGDKEKAKKFACKSQKLYPLKEAESKCCSAFIFEVFCVYDYGF